MIDARAALAEVRKQAEDRLAALTHDYDGMVAASRDTNADDEHDPEGATIAFERSQIGALVSQARVRLAEIDAALARLNDGTYGNCGACGRSINEARLAARPETRACIDCARTARQS